MTASRDDLGIEGNTARRKFWEMCASREPQCLHIEVGDSGSHYLTKEDTDDLARWADQMLAEWDKRWIVGEDK